jgi:outer membrane immunogenic protein
MNRWFLATAGVLVIAAACPASAADLGMPMKAPPIAPPLLYNWTGFYIGGNGGGAWTHDTVTLTGSDGATGSGSADANGWFAGGQIGFNWQFATN